MSKNVFITGGTGFLGCHLARALLKENYAVTLFDIAPLDATDLIGKVTSIQGDIRNKKELEKAIKNHDFVVHAAAALPIARDKKIIFENNVEGTKNVLEACLKQKVKRLVFISTTAVYGVPKHLPEKEDSPLDPIGYYGQSKIAAENLCKEYMQKGLEVNILRAKTFLGPERLGVFALWFDAIHNNKSVFLLGKGNNKYQLLAVSDMVSAIIRSLESKTKNEIFNIGAKEFGTWRQDLGYVIKKEHSKAKIVGFPILPSQFALMILEKLNLSPIAAWHYKTIPVDSYISVEKAETLLNWHPKKSNKELLLESYHWYKQHRKDVINRVGNTHRVGWNFQALNLVRKFF